MKKLILLGYLGLVLNQSSFANNFHCSASEGRYTYNVDAVSLGSTGDYAILVEEQYAKVNLFEKAVNKALSASGRDFYSGSLKKTYTWFPAKLDNRGDSFYFKGAEGSNSLYIDLKDVENKNGKESFAGKVSLKESNSKWGGEFFSVEFKQARKLKCSKKVSSVKAPSSSFQNKQFENLYK
ncbi:hypothetical protein MJH12_06940 [bacterium]|nr:hypothetical protein [bacterium]